ncbi:MAG: class I SAM-dependent methyltransferase [Planctomycetes bacterium]|nr:class I SAM-dependent methyltransferase [Planctomycetota bacterium]
MIFPQKKPLFTRVKHWLKLHCPKPILVPMQLVYRPIRYVCHNLQLYINHHGGSLECYCCGKKSKFFLPLAEDGAERAAFNANRSRKVSNESVCPHCGSFPRQRVGCYWLSERWNRPEDAKVMVLAPESCMTLFLKRKNIPYKTADLFAENVDMRFDLQNIPLENDSWDIIICNHVLEHVNDDIKALSEMIRILKPTGAALITVPTNLDSAVTVESMPTMNDKDRTELCGQFDHIRLYGSDVTDRLNTCSRCEVFDGSTIDDRVMQAVGPGSIDVNLLYICKKP